MNNQILLAHGGGGSLMQGLIENIFSPAFLMSQNAQQDAAVLSVGQQSLAFTSDSYVVDPLFFPGGDIGSLSVYGTVNDLAMMGALPLYLSASFILEEGLDIGILQKVVFSMQEAAQLAGVQIVTGDTKVVERGRGHGIFINTAGIGLLKEGQNITPQGIRADDAILLNGDLGRHGISIMCAREKLDFEPEIKSDLAPLVAIVQALLQEGIEIHAMRDLTRGGLSSALNEIAQAARLEIALEESNIVISPQVRGVCELLGLDPLYVANEGRFIAFVPAAQVEKSLSIMKSFADLGEHASCIGFVNLSRDALVTIKNSFSQVRILSLLSGQQLPRIC